jgi:mannose-6-phosphate isomerase-like protein (cupin superfamily)
MNMNEPVDETKRYRLVQMDEVPATDCPCGQAKRAFADEPGAPASLHITDITEEATTHYHQRMTEIYYVLEGEGEMELDGERFPVRPGSAVMIHPGCRHRAIGTLRIINVPVPAFDPSDEHFD